VDTDPRGIRSDGDPAVANPLEKLLRAGEGRILKRLQQVVKAVNALEEDYSQLSDDELRGETAELRARYADLASRSTPIR